MEVEGNEETECDKI